MQIRHVAALLGYDKPQILEIFKNTLPIRLYWVLFPIDDLNLAVETAKRILTKEKIDRQLEGQATSTPFMKVRDGYNNTTAKPLTFNMQVWLEDKIDKLTSMMRKLTAQGSKQDKQYKPKIYQGKKRRQMKHNYDQGSYWTRNRSISFNVI